MPSGNNPINIVFAIIFVFIGLFMTLIGVSMLASGPSNETEWTIALFSLLAAFFLFYGAWQTWQNQKRQQHAEKQEASRLASKFGNPKKVRRPIPVQDSGNVEEPEAAITESEETNQPIILACWLYPKKEWNTILNKLAEKTKKEELYTAFWFPVFFAIIFWSLFWVGILMGLAFGALYVWFRTYFVKSKFAIKGNAAAAEVIISDAYLRINGNFIHYGDGRYFLKNLLLVNDPKIGELLHFEIGWFTSKGLPAQMDLYLPIPVGKVEEANAVVEAYKIAQS